MTQVPKLNLLTKLDRTKSEPFRLGKGTEGGESLAQVGGVVTGAAKGLGQLVQGTGNLAARGVYAAELPIAKAAVNLFSGGKKQVDPNMTVGSLADENTNVVSPESLQAQGPYEKAGKTAFDIASVFAQPEVAVDKIGVKGLEHLAESGALSPETVSKISGAIESKFGKAVARGIENMAQGSAYGAVTAAGQGRDDIGKEALIAGAGNVIAEPLAKNAGAILGKAAEVGGKALDSVGGALGRAADTTSGIDSKIASGVSDIFSGRPLTPAEEAMAIVRKPQTQGYQKMAADEGRFVQEPGLLGRRTIKPDISEVSMSEAVQPLVDEGRITRKMNPVEQQKVIDDEARSINESVKGQFKKEGGSVSIDKTDFDSRISALKSDRDILLQSEPSADRAYDAVVRKFNTFLEKNDTEGLFEARQHFDQFMKSKYPNAFKKNASGDLDPVNSAINTAYYDIRNSVNEMIGEYHPEYRPSMLRESNLIKAADTVGQRELVGTGDTNFISRLFQGKSTKDKLLTAGAMAAATAAAGGLGAGVVSAVGNGK